MAARRKTEVCMRLGEYIPWEPYSPKVMRGFGRFRRDIEGAVPCGVIKLPPRAAQIVIKR